MFSWMNSIVYLGLKWKWSYAHAVVYLHSSGHAVEITKGNYLNPNTSHFKSNKNKQIALSVHILMYDECANKHSQNERTWCADETNDSNGTRIALVNNESVCLSICLFAWLVGLCVFLCIGQVKDFFNETGYICLFVHMLSKENMLQQLLIVWPIRVFLL